MGISLWIVSPSSSAITSKLKGIITSISESRSSPNFHPHVTLASLPKCVSLEETTSCFFATKGPIGINFGSVRTGQTYFQSVFIAVEATQALLDLHKHIHNTLGIQPKTPEFPHLSLYYGTEDKEDIARVAEKSLSIAAGDGFGFLAEEIWIVDCEGHPESWTVLEKIALPLK